MGPVIIIIASFLTFILVFKYIYYRVIHHSNKKYLKVNLRRRLINDLYCVNPHRWEIKVFEGFWFNVKQLIYNNTVMIGLSFVDYYLLTLYSDFVIPYKKDKESQQAGLKHIKKYFENDIKEYLEDRDSNEVKIGTMLEEINKNGKSLF